MRIAFLSRSKRRTRGPRYAAAALRRAGHPVLAVNERRRRRWLGARAARATALASVRRFRPDLVLVHGNDASPALLEGLAASHRTALFTDDCWTAPLSGPVLELARRVDLVLTVAAGQVPELEAAGVRRAAWLPEACEPRVHFPLESAGPAWRSDVAFVGKRHAKLPGYAARSELVRAVHERFDTRVYGRGWEELGIAPARREVGPSGYRRVCRGARIVLGRDWNDACHRYFSNRTWYTLGCGGFLLTNYVPGLEEIFRNHGELVWYRSPEECFELIEHYLPRPEERARIAEAGREFAWAHRSYDHFARDLVGLVEGRPLAFPPARPG